jgi:hypothetical protein
MPHRIKALAVAVFASSLVVAMELSASGPASAASECVKRTDQDGHRQRVDRIHHRQCRFVETMKVTEMAALPKELPRPDAGSEQSWLSWLVSGLHQTLALGTPQPDHSDDKTTATSIPAPNLPKTSARVSKHRSRAKPRPETHDTAGSHLPLSPAVRDALFQEFLRRYQIEKSIPPNPQP